MGMLFKVSKTRLRGTTTMTVIANFGSNGRILNLGHIEGYYYDFVVDWGDGSATEHYTTYGANHTYPDENLTYTVTITGVMEILAPTYSYLTGVFITDYYIGETNIKILRLSGGILSAPSTTQDYRVTFTEQLSSGVKSFRLRSDAVANCTQCNHLKYLNTSNITDMSYMFKYFKGASLDISNFNTGRATTMNQMFYGCYFLKNVNVSVFDVSKVTTMVQMFYGNSFMNTSAPSSWWDGSNPQITNPTSAFFNNTNRPNYASIPAGWK